MKSYLFLFLFVLISLFGFSQEVLVASEDDLRKSVTSGEILMVLPGHVTADEVQKYSKYYTMYFTTSFNMESHEVKFSMVNNEPKARRVIIRFLSAVGTKSVKVEEVSIPLSEFYEFYLR